MQSKNLDLLVDVQNGRLISSFDSTAITGLPSFTLGDGVPVTARFVKPSGRQDRPWDEVDITGQSVRVAIGTPGARPSLGSYTITYDGDTTSALQHNATAAAMQTALNALDGITSAGGVTVVEAASGLYRIVFNSPGERLAFTADTSGLYPTSGSFFTVAQTGDGSTREVVLLKLETQPAAYAELTDNLPSAAGTVDVLQEGDTAVSAIHRITLDPAPIGGTWTYTVDGEETLPLAHDISAADLASAISALGAIGATNATATGEGPQWTVTFDDSLGDVGAASVDASGLDVPTGRAGELSVNTAGIKELLGGSANAQGVFEVELVDDISGITWTPYQAVVTVRDDVIPNDPTSQTGGPVFVTVAMLDAVRMLYKYIGTQPVFTADNADKVLGWEFGSNQIETLPDPGDLDLPLDTRISIMTLNANTLTIEEGLDTELLIPAGKAARTRAENSIIHLHLQAKSGGVHTWAISGDLAAAPAIELPDDNHTLGTADDGRELRVATTIDVIIPLNSTTAFPDDFQVAVLSTSGTPPNIVATAGVEINGIDEGLTSLIAYSGAVLTRIAEDEWVISGGIETVTAP